MKYTIKTALSIMITTLILGCGTTDDSKGNSTSIESLLSSGVLSGTTTSTMDNKNTDVKVSKENGTYKVEYPSLACKGTLEIISTSATEMIFKINFTEGSCLSGTKLKLTDIGNNQVAINEYSPSTVVTPAPDTNTNASVPYESFALNDGRFTSTSNNSSSSYTILTVSNAGKDIIVDYPSSHCNAKWTSIGSPSLNSIRFKETITHGTCTTNNIIEARKDSSNMKELELTFFKPDGIAEVRAPNSRYSTQTLYYHDDQATHSTHELSARFSITKSYSQYGNFILNAGRFTSTSNNSSSSYTILHSYNNGKDIIVDYPSSHCNAKWTSIESPSLNSIRFRETITHGTCTTNNIIEVRKDSSNMKELELTFFKPDGIAEVRAPNSRYSTQTLYNHNDQVSTATLENTGSYTPVTQQPNTQNNPIPNTNTQTNTSITVGNTALISTYSGGGRFKISNGNLAIYSASGVHEDDIRSNINSIVPLPKGKVLVLKTTGSIAVIDYINPPFSTLYSASTNLTSLQGGSYSSGTVYVGSQSFDVSQYTQ